MVALDHTWITPYNIWITRA